MKKRILIMVAIASMASSAVFAQTEDTRDALHFGFKVGVNLSNVYDQQGESYVADNKFGLATGVFLAVPIGRYFGIQPELLFSQKGFSSTGKFLGNSYDFTRTSNYLEIPLLAAFKPSEMVTLLFGPEFSYLLKQKDVYTNSNVTASQTQLFDNENLRKNTLSLLTGLDINLQQFVIGGRVGWDLTNNNGDGTSTAPRYKNVWYQATVGLRF